MWERTIASLQRTEHPFDLVLFDNGSTDGTEKRVAEMGGVCNTTDNHWIGHGFREAVELALETEPDLILFSADDYEYLDGWLERLVAFWDKASKDVGIVSCHLEPHFRWNGILDVVDVGEKRALWRDTVPGSNWSFRPSLWSLLKSRVPDNAHKYDKKTCRWLRAEHGLMTCAMDLARHIGDRERAWTNDLFPEADLVDKELWGLSMIEEGIRRAKESNAMLYNRKSNCPEDRRDIDLRFLYRLAEQAPDGVAIECGVYTGGSLACWAIAREGRGTIYANDKRARRALRECIKRYALDVTVLLMAAKDVPAAIDEEVAFCFIDADHGEGGITEDIKVWPDKMMSGGILAFHDYGVRKCPAVKREVDKWQAKAKWTLLGQVGSTIAFQKP